MKEVLYILFGALFTVATAWALGGLLFQRLQLRLRGGEHGSLAFVTGASCLSGIVFLLCSVHVVYKGVFLGFGTAILLWAARKDVLRSGSERKPTPIPRVWLTVCGVAFAVYAAIYAVYAMAPEMSPDGTAYHLVYPARYLRFHGFHRVTWDIYANITQGVELLYLFAYSFGRQSAAALVHLSFLIALPCMMIAYGRRFGIPLAGLAGALFVFVCPVVAIDGTTAYNDVALAAVAFAVFHLLQIWDQEGDWRLLVPAGLLAGFAFAVKYTGFIAVLYAVGFVLWRRGKTRTQANPPAPRAVIIATLAAFMVLPWLIKNAVVVGDPLAPFATRLFPNPYVHTSFEDSYRQYYRRYTLTSYRQVPQEVTFKGEALNGLLGPLFLLSPLALFALKWPAGRQLLLAAIVFGSTYFLNIGTRFLIPMLPFLSLALAVVLSRARPVLLAVIVAHVVLSWPGVVKQYCSRWAWRLDDSIPFSAAFRHESADTYLSRKCPGYPMARVIEQAVPKGEKILAFTPIAASYTSHDILVNYQAAPNELLGDMLFNALYSERQPTSISEFQFAERELRRIRLVQTAGGNDVRWSASEIRVFDRTHELPRDPAWRLHASVNPWDVQLAFDNAAVTRWDSWQPAAPGMYIEVDFGSSYKIDAVRIESEPQPGISMKLEGQEPSGRWMELSRDANCRQQRMTVGMRRAATAELKARGIRYVVVDSTDAVAGDFAAHTMYWDLNLIAERGSSRLYRIN
ncbi:MAG TPA: glycosyltransferase family 39 protein [Bryobacteraceae bacterium]|nr:glycosyltransferase family 39 protein [Bryobacteraceae bacterium]